MQVPSFHCWVESGPRCPSAGWLPELCHRKVGLIASGGSRMFALLGDETVSTALTTSLLRRLQVPSSSQTDFDNDSESIAGKSLSMASFERDLDMQTEMELRGHADCVLLAGGRTFFCHRAILAHRSAELRNRIAVESVLSAPTGSGRIPPPTHLLLPELPQKDVAKAFLYFLYRDCLPQGAAGDALLLGSLSRAARALRLPRLQVLCESFLGLVSELAGSEDGIEDSLSLPWELPPPTLARLGYSHCDYH